MWTPRLPSQTSSKNTPWSIHCTSSNKIQRSPTGSVFPNPKSLCNRANSLCHSNVHSFVRFIESGVGQTCDHTMVHPFRWSPARLLCHRHREGGKGPCDQRPQLHNYTFLYSQSHFPNDLKTCKWHSGMFLQLYITVGSCKILKKHKSRDWSRIGLLYINRCMWVRRKQNRANFI